MAKKAAPRTNAPFSEAAVELVARDGRTIRALAEELPYGFPYLHRLIHGKRPVSTLQMEQIAALFDLPGSYFVEVRLARITEYLASHPVEREQLWERLQLSRS